MKVMIGIDPHKASHTAVALDGAGDQLSSVKVRATSRQVDHLINWAEGFEKRTWPLNPQVVRAICSPTSWWLEGKCFSMRVLEAHQHGQPDMRRECDRRFRRRCSPQVCAGPVGEFSGPIGVASSRGPQ